MNSALRRLELDGRIARRPHPDSRRADSWSLTEKGLADLERVRRITDSIFTKMLAPLDGTELTALQDYLRRCITALEADAVPREAASEQPKRRVAKRSTRSAAAA
jgi:DNA-binding MarR family transcriptional regulator